MQDNQSAVLSALTEVLNRLADKESIPSAGDLLEQISQQYAQKLSVGNGNSQAVPIEIGNKMTVSPKLDFAVEYLKQNPSERKKSGRDLETSVLMSGETISYKWWNKAKNEV